MRINNNLLLNDPKNLYLQSKLRKLLFNAINSKNNNLLYKIGNIDKLIKSGNIEAAERELKNIEKDNNIEKINKNSAIDLNNFDSNKNLLYDSKGNILQKNKYIKTFDFKG